MTKNYKFRTYINVSKFRTDSIFIKFRTDSIFKLQLDSIFKLLVFI